MKKINYLTLALVALTVAASASIWTDDFESYPIGYDIGDSADWTALFWRSQVEEAGGNKYVATEGAVYSYDRTGDISDSRVSFDFMFVSEEDENQLIKALFRIDDGYDSGYIVSFIREHDCYYGNGDYVHVGVLVGSGTSYLLPDIFFLGDYFETGIWYHFEAELYGHPVFNYYVTLNGDVNESGTIDRGNYAVADGLSGFGVMNGFYNQVDNFEVDDDPVFTGIKSASLGEIKASFR